MKRKASTLGALLLMVGCGGQPLHPDLMGTTAKCQHNTKQNFEAGSKDHQSAMNECMWAKAGDMKD